MCVSILMATNLFRFSHESISININLMTSFLLVRVLKQALKGSGPNLTASHMADMSLCALFLLDASKRVDEQLRVHIKSSHHTTRDADKDITKMASYLVEENAESEDLSRTGTTFVDPIKKGADKIASGYIDKYLKRTALYDDCDEEEPDIVLGRDEVADLEYELYHTN